MPSGGGNGRHADVVVIGAGIVGLAHAVEADRRGLSVLVIDRDGRARGASVRNFGHGYVTAQAGDALEAAIEARRRWVELSRAAGFWLVESGSVLVARLPEEMAVVEEFAARRPDQAEVLGPVEVLARVPVSPAELLGGLWTPLDCRVDAREALPALARWLADARRVGFLWSTTALEVEPGRVRTSRGDVRAGAIVIAAGHDLDRLMPTVAGAAGVRRCTLHMLRIAAPSSRPIVPAIATGLATLRYRGFADLPSLPALRARLREERPDLLDHEINLLITQRPDGDLILGDTHEYAGTPAPFQDERLDQLLLDEAARLLGAAPLTVRERWHGVYAHAPGREFLIHAPAAGVRAVVVTSGIGMTTAFGLAPRVLDELVDESG